MNQGYESLMKTALRVLSAWRDRVEPDEDDVAALERFRWGCSADRRSRSVDASVDLARETIVDELERMREREHARRTTDAAAG